MTILGLKFIILSRVRFTADPRRYRNTPFFSSRANPVRPRPCLQHERKSREYDEQVTQVLTHLDKCEGGGEIGVARKKQVRGPSAWFPPLVSARAFGLSTPFTFTLRHS